MALSKNGWFGSAKTYRPWRGGGEDAAYTFFLILIYCPQFATISMEIVCKFYPGPPIIVQASVKVI